MAVIKSADQFKYTGKGPLDAKALVKTYADLLSEATWTVDDKLIAYNGMIVAVWLNLTDTTKNGIYFLHDTAVTRPIDKPNVTNEANWHKLGGLNDLPGLAEQVATIQSDLEAVKADVDELQDSATVVRDSKSLFPETGLPGKIYVALKEATTYVWYNDDYLPVGDGSGESGDIQIIHGGGPSAI